ncbi:11006_t:CDS:1 [Funneliformis caledonium]|uniref:11006_t:CDS:1 n=1 Tax=Funneliformis caledonium TaxID=1117310 RepID=A0A9N9EBQ4_9GLOM|nr:11006_t:CDS:1 [Funneliformis caledonium]
MFIGSFLAGSIPLAFHLSEDRLRTISAFGVGLLVGTSLIVIIPEGIETLYSVSGSINLNSSPITPTIKDNILEQRNMWNNVELQRKGPNNYDDNLENFLQKRTLKVEDRPNDYNKRQEMDPLPDSPNQPPNDDPPTKSPENQPDEHDHGKENANHHYIGFALVSGFAMMFVIDQIDSSHGHTHTRGNVVSLTELRSLANSSDRDVEDHEMLGGSSSIHKKPASATIGLVIHAAADGIALGASASQPALEIIVFLAIMLHKAPAAFGLSTILLRESYTRRQIRKHLLTFSLAAPLAAVFTYSLLQRSGEMNPNIMKWWTAMLLLFSGGTFLYVAMHVMQDVTNGNGKDNGFNGHHLKIKKSHVAFMLLGMFMPLLLQFEHGHGH